MEEKKKKQRDREDTYRFLRDPEAPSVNEVLSIIENSADNAKHPSRKKRTVNCTV